MAELKQEVQKNIGPKVGVRTEAVPQTRPVQPQFTQVRVQPNPFAEALSGIAAALPQKADDDSVGYEQAFIDWNEGMMSAATDALRTDDPTTSWWQVRAQAVPLAIQLGRRYGLNSKQQKAFMSQIRSSMSDQFNAPLISQELHKESNQRIVSFAGQPVMTEQNAIDITVSKLAMLQEQYPTEADDMIAMMATGRMADGSEIPLPESSAEGPNIPAEAWRRRQVNNAVATVEATFANLTKVDAITREVKQIKASTELLGASAEERKLLNARGKAEMRSLFTQEAGNRIAQVYSKNGFLYLNQPPEVGLSAVEEALTALENSPEYAEFSEGLDDFEFLGGVKKQVMERARMIFSSNNMNEIRKYNVETQDLMLKYLSNQLILDQGLDVAAVIGNADKLKMLADSVTTLNALQRTEGATSNLMSAGTLSILSGTTLANASARIGYVEAHRGNPGQQVPHLQWLIDDVTEQVNNFVMAAGNGGPISNTPHALLRYLSDLKSNKAVASFLESSDIDEDTRSAIINALNGLESRLIRAADFTKEDVDRIKREYKKQAAIFEE